MEVNVTEVLPEIAAAMVWEFISARFQPQQDRGHAYLQPAREMIEIGGSSALEEVRSLTLPSLPAPLPYYDLSENQAFYPAARCQIILHQF